MVEVFDNTTSGGASQEEEIVDRWKLVYRTNNSQAIIEINSTLRERVGPGVEIVDIQQGKIPQPVTVINSQTSFFSVSLISTLRS